MTENPIPPVPAAIQNSKNLKQLSSAMYEYNLELIEIIENQNTDKRLIREYLEDTKNIMSK